MKTVKQELKELGFTFDSDKQRFVFYKEDYESSSNIKAVHVSVDITETLTVEWDCFVDTGIDCYGWIASFWVYMGLRKEDVFKKNFQTQEELVDFAKKLIDAWKRKDEDFLLQELEVAEFLCDLGRKQI